MSRVKIISRRSSFAERAITFEVDGRVREVSAPACVATFEDLERMIEQEVGATKAVEAAPAETAPKAEPESKAQTKRGRKSSKSNEEQVE